MDVSLIIVSWNAKNFLIDCLHSLTDIPREYSQEIIVVDNNSSDGSPEVVKSKFPDVKLLINEENLGFSKANNIGVRHSTGRYLFFINSDVKVLDNCVEKMVSFMDSHPNAGMSGPRILNHDMTLQHSCRHFPGIWNNFCLAIGLSRLLPNVPLFSEPFMKYWDHNSVKKVEVLTGCFWVVRRHALDEVGLLDENFFFYGEDVDWCRRFNQAGWDILFNPNAQSIHFGGASSAAAPFKYYIQMQKADLHYWKKHHSFLLSRCFLLIIIIRHIVRILPYLIMIMTQRKKKEHWMIKLKCCLGSISWSIKQIISFQ
jgi:hypothetical protein